MFGSKTPENQSKKSVSRKDNSFTILTEGCFFEGKLHCRGATRIGGRINGEIISEGKLIIEETAVIEANIQAENAIVQGEVHGSLNAKGTVEITQSAVFVGDISTPSLIVHKGAVFNGSSHMKEQVDARSTNVKSLKSNKKIGAETQKEMAMMKGLEDQARPSTT